jgi:hypothetical protein
MLAARIAVASAAAVLAAPAAALAAHSRGTHGPSATPLLVELAVVAAAALAMLARRPATHVLRAALAKLADRRAHRRLRKHAY